MDTLPSYEDFERYLDEVGDVAEALVSGVFGDTTSSTDPFHSTLIRYAIQYLFDKNPDDLATVAMTDLAAAGLEDSPLLINPYWPNDCRDLYHLGYWPYRRDVKEYSVYLYLKYTDAELEKANLIREDRHTIQHSIAWFYSPVGILRQAAITTARGLRLSLQAPDLIYKSGRPKTDMAIFRNSNSNRIQHSKIVDGMCVIENTKWSVIPITRYAKGMSRSLYYQDNKEPNTIEWCGSSKEPSTTQWCGTFYYYEPESTTFLAYKRAHRSFNKSTAMRELLAEAGREDTEHRVAKVLFDAPALKHHISGRLDRSLNITRQGVTFYGGDMTYKMYGAEDDLDQPLCQLAAELGYDIVILENMVGGFQVVTEVLDVRTRHDSFLSLVYTY